LKSTWLAAGDALYFRQRQCRIRYSRSGNQWPGDCIPKQPGSLKARIKRCRALGSNKWMEWGRVELRLESNPSKKSQMRSDLMNLMRSLVSRSLIQRLEFRCEGSEISLVDCVLKAGPYLMGCIAVPIRRIMGRMETSGAIEGQSRPRLPNEVALRGVNGDTTAARRSGCGYRGVPFLFGGEGEGDTSARIVLAELTRDTHSTLNVL
jgi:hypothetical protein